MLSTDMSSPPADGKDGSSTPARIAYIISALWSHEGAFRDAEGGHLVRPLQIRNRLGASVVLDCFSWWRRLYKPSKPSDTGENRGSVPIFYGVEMLEPGFS